MGLFKPNRIAHAHCHVPCGIYDPVFARNAAETVVKMVEQIDGLAVPGPEASAAEQKVYQQAMTRRVVNKEEHARKCKYELLDVLWSQYFKPVHVDRWPNLHELFFRAGHLCTLNMQEIDIAMANELLAVVDEIAVLFQESKS